MTESRTPISLFAVRTTAGQEKTVAELISARAQVRNIPIKSVLVPETLKGYVFIEADGSHYVEEAISGVKHIRSRVSGKVDLSEVESYIIMKPVIKSLDIDAIVEIISGPFKGMRAKVTRIDNAKNEVTLELLEAAFTLPITVHSDYVRLIEKPKEGE
ncbi:MAG: transcription elongation factor Spt5 [Candidatus Bathyarchaeia archaeon]